MSIINISLCLFFLILPISAMEQIDCKQDTGIVSAGHFLNVDAFLKKCAKGLGIYDSSYQDPLWCLPPSYDRNYLVTVGLHDEKGNIRWHEVYDPRHELMNGHEFTCMDKAGGGTRG